MAFIYLRLCDNDFGNELQLFGEDIIYNWGNHLLEMSEDEIKEQASIFVAGYHSYSQWDRKDKTPQENFNEILEYIRDGLKVIKSKNWPSETYVEFGSDDDHGSVIIDVYGKKCFYV
jgi:single-stranded DNA-binding protein